MDDLKNCSYIPIIFLTGMMEQKYFPNFSGQKGDMLKKLYSIINVVHCGRESERKLFKNLMTGQERLS
jgi:hypothetical protein